MFNCCCSGNFFSDTSLKANGRGEVVFFGMSRHDVEIPEGGEMDLVLVDCIEHAAGKKNETCF